jgi:hypothetical protein
MFQVVITLLCALIPSRTSTVQSDDRSEFVDFSSPTELTLDKLIDVAGGTDNGPRGSW